MWAVKLSYDLQLLMLHMTRLEPTGFECAAPVAYRLPPLVIICSQTQA